MHSFKIQTSFRPSTTAGSVPEGRAVPTHWATHQERIPATLLTGGILAAICCPKRVNSLMSHLTALALSKTKEQNLTSQVLNQLARACS